jgi:glucosamine-6-phosphate deaminase
VTRVLVFRDPDELGQKLAAEILAAYGRTDGPFLLGCPGGRSLRTTYRALAANAVALPRLVAVLMDEYAGATAADHFSCRRFAEEELARPLGLREDQVWLPDGSDPAAYDERIAAAGGIDLFLLASGASDGHLAFVPPGAPRDGGTALVELAESTRRDNLATFPGFAALADVPRRGVSVGLATIAAARSLRLVLHGADERGAAARPLALGRYEPKWPASIVHEHHDAEIWLDAEAQP